MSDLAIRAEGLSKRYRVGTRNPEPESVGGKLGGLLTSPFRYLSATLREPTEKETVWAIRDVSFDIPRGRVVGLIGRNGAGKSTLLKVLTRITDPTHGRAEITGRVGSLLEVGTGFHPELTGRENVFLNGSILGMSRREISSKFDEIVDFAGVERFLETQVKRYSSGMYVRLAFSVAAHLEPEILIVDEVLAVGDAAFQRRCLEKMEEVTSDGRTILFVSHNMAAINRLCPTALLMDGGRLVEYGDVADVTRRYLADEAAATSEWRLAPDDLRPEADCQITAARVVSATGERAESVQIDEPLRVEVEYEVRRPMPDLHVQIQVLNQGGEVLFVSADHLHKNDLGFTHNSGAYRSSCVLPANLLAEGAHYISVVLINLNERRKIEAHRRILAFWVVDPSHGGTVRGNCPGDWPGLIRPMLEWKVDRLSTANDAGAARVAQST
jgi:lipopolysaccharide transport system ATP-binding protein